MMRPEVVSNDQNPDGLRSLGWCFSMWTTCCWCFKPNLKSLLVAWTKVSQQVLTDLLHHLRIALLYRRNPTSVNVLTSTSIVHIFNGYLWFKTLHTTTIANSAILAVGCQQVFLDLNKCFPYPLDRLSFQNERTMKLVIQQRLRLGYIKHSL